MSYLLLDSIESVQVYSPQLVGDVLICTIQSFPSGSVIMRTIPQVDFDADRGKGLLSSFSDAVENVLQAGTATSAYGLQLVDDSGLLVDLVRFTVTFAQPAGTPGSITATVDVPVLTLTADTSITGGSAGFESAAELVNDTYQRLAAMSSG